MRSGWHGWDAWTRNRCVRRMGITQDGKGPWRAGTGGDVSGEGGGRAEISEQPQRSSLNLFDDESNRQSEVDA
jgi:hypothetical protein